MNKLKKLFLACLALPAIQLTANAQIAISGLPELTTPADADLAVMVDDSEAVVANKTKKITWLNLKNGIASATMTMTNKTLTDPALNGNITNSTSVGINAIFESTQVSLPGSGGAGIVVRSTDGGSSMEVGDRLGYFLFGGQDGAAAALNSAGIVAYATENWTTTSGSRLTFAATPNGTNTRTDYLQIGNDGAVDLLNGAAYDFADISSALVSGTISNVTGANGDQVMIKDATDGSFKAVLWENLPSGSGSGFTAAALPATANNWESQYWYYDTNMTTARTISGWTSFSAGERIIAVIEANGATAGDRTITFPNAMRRTGFDATTTTLVLEAGQFTKIVIEYDGTNYYLTDSVDPGLDLESVTLTNILDTEILIGTGAGTANYAAVSGDATLANTGALTIANDAVSLAKMASGTAGNIITYDASGNPAAVATGTSGQVLTSNGAGAAPTFQDSTGSYSETQVDINDPTGDFNIDWSAGNRFFEDAVDATPTVTFSNDTNAQQIEVVLTSAAGSTITWPTVSWATGTPPALGSGETGTYTFLKVNGTVYGWGPGDYLDKAYGAIYWATPAATTTVTDTPTKALGTTAAQGNASLTTQGTANRLTYTGSNTRDFLAHANVSLSASAATQATIYIAVNGVELTESAIVRDIPNTDIGAMAVQAMVELGQNDYVELWVATNDGDSLTVEAGVLMLFSMDGSNANPGDISIAVADLNDTTTPTALTTAETDNKIISNYKSTGADHVFTLPAAHANGNLTFVVGDEFQVDIEPPSGTALYLNGTALATDEHIQNISDTLGDTIVGVCVNINGTMTWMFKSDNANWVEDTP